MRHVLLFFVLISTFSFSQNWETVAELPGNSPISQIHYVSDTEIYVSSQYYQMHRWNGSEWAAVGDFSTTFMNYFQYVSENEIYATRNDHPSGNGTTEFNFIAQWNGTNWTNLGDLNTDETIYNFKVISPNEVYAVGEIDDINGNRWYSVAQYDGTSWSVVGEGDSLYGTYNGNNSLWVSNSNEIYTRHDQYSSGGVQKVKRWDGNQWTLLFNAADEIDGVDRIHVVNPNEIYISTYKKDTQYPALGYWNGTYWRVLGDIQTEMNTGNFVGSIDFTYVSPNEIYIVGSALRDRNTFTYHVGYWNGTRWNKLGSLGGNRPARALFLDEDKYLYVGGSFTESGKTLIKRIQTQEALSTRDAQSAQQIQIYPNPTSEWVYLPKEFKEVTLYNLLGRQVLKERNLSKINLSQFQKGIYLLKLTDEQGTVFSRKVIKQ